MTDTSHYLITGARGHLSRRLNSQHSGFLCPWQRVTHTHTVKRGTVPQALLAVLLLGYSSLAVALPQRVSTEAEHWPLVSFHHKTDPPNPSISSSRAVFSVRLSRYLWHRLLICSLPSARSNISMSTNPSLARRINTLRILLPLCVLFLRQLPAYLGSESLAGFCTRGRSISLVCKPVRWRWQSWEGRGAIVDRLGC